MVQRRKNTQINQMLPQDAPVHNWYRFVLSFPPHVVRDYLHKLGADRGCSILDPFCGTGTTVVECQKQGIAAYGLEANPMAYFASTTKTTWGIDANDFLQASLTIADEATEAIEQSGVRFPSDLPLFGPSDPDIDLWDLADDQWKVLSRDFISALPLHRTLILLEKIRLQKDNRFQCHHELAVAKSLVSGIGNVAFGPEIGATAPKYDVDAVSIWLHECRRIAEDLRLVHSQPFEAQSIVLRGDARTMPGNSPDIDIVITSPPYPNEKDYTRTTRLESVILGFIKNRQDLRNLKYDLLRSNTRNVYVADDDQKWIQHIDSVKLLAQSIEERRIELGKTSGFERLYHRVVELYFGGMARHFMELRKILRPGARLAYVVGDQMSYFRIPIRTGALLADIAERIGYRVESIDLFRTRLSTTTKQWIREEVVVLSWSGSASIG